MQRKIYFSILIAFFCSATSAFSQQASVENLTPKGVTEDQSLYTGGDEKIYYIDFEDLRMNLSEIILKNNQGTVLLKDDVFDLPVNTIYELDLSQYGTGTFEVELRSFTGVIRKTIAVE
ncbi:MAG: hypothetical protein HUU01_00300 [Saprospiraceae bacterium]|nr:hypothetical protein [Saprospiraceae bacterium]